MALALHPVGVDVHDDAAELPQHEEARALAQAFFPKPLLNACLRTEADPWSWLTCWGELEARLKREGLPLQECGLQPDPRRDHALRQGWSLHGRHDCGWPRLALSGRDELAGSDA